MKSCDIISKMAFILIFMEGVPRSVNIKNTEGTSFRFLSERKMKDKNNL